jgi:DUF177 domain-containing protein
VSRLDARAPLVLDTRELGRRPGAMRSVAFQAPAPADLRIAVIGIPEGAPVDLDLRLESVVEGVLVSGTARARAVGECVRCLEPVDLPVVVEVQELFVYPDREDRSRGGSEDGATDEAHELRSIEDDLLDLEPVLRDAAVLALPLKPLCQEDCLGLCVECGARLADDPEHHHDLVDPRWAALASLVDSPTQTPVPSTPMHHVSQEES